MRSALKNKKMANLELLAPSGNFSKLKCALYFGADAVYIGGKDFSLRSFADNFTREEMQLAIDYAKNILNASKITLGVFSNNDCARHCYESVGFRSTGETEIYKMPIGEWECIEMELAIS